MCWKIYFNEVARAPNDLPLDAFEITKFLSFCFALYEFSSSLLRKRLSFSIRNPLLPTAATIYLPWTALTNSIYIILDETWHLWYTIPHISTDHAISSFSGKDVSIPILFLVNTSHYALNQLLNMFQGNILQPSLWQWSLIKKIMIQTGTSVSVRDYNKWLGIMKGLGILTFAPCIVLGSERCGWPFETSLAKTSAHQVDQFSRHEKWGFEGSIHWTHALWHLSGQHCKCCLHPSGHLWCNKELCVHLFRPALWNLFVLLTELLPFSLRAASGQCGLRSGVVWMDVKWLLLHSALGQTVRQVKSNNMYLNASVTESCLFSASVLRPGVT